MLRQQEVQGLQQERAALQTEVDHLKNRVDDLRDELVTQKRKQAANIKDLVKHLTQGPKKEKKFKPVKFPRRHRCSKPNLRSQRSEYAPTSQLIYSLALAKRPVCFSNVITSI